MIRKIEEKDMQAVCDIYNYYVEQTYITFEEEAVTPAEMTQRMIKVTGSYPWIVWEDAGGIQGYAYATRWKERAAYRHSVESTVYLRKGAGGRGIGTKLYSRLLEDLKHQGVHAVLGGVTLPNPASQGLHEKLGFKQVARLEEVGFKFGKWVDVGYWQKIL